MTIFLTILLTAGILAAIAGFTYAWIKWDWFAAGLAYFCLAYLAAAVVFAIGFVSYQIVK